RYLHQIVERPRRTDGAATVQPGRHRGWLLHDAQSGADRDGNALWLGIIGRVGARKELDGTAAGCPEPTRRVAHPRSAPHRDEPGEIPDPRTPQGSRPEAAGGEKARADDEIGAPVRNRRK